MARAVMGGRGIWVSVVSGPAVWRVCAESMHGPSVCVLGCVWLAAS